MIFFLDENFPVAARELLSRRGHETMDIRGTQHEGSPDSTIFEMAQQKRAVFLTTDRDFWHTVPVLYEQHYGIVVIALRQPNRRRILSRLEWFLDHFEGLNLKNRVFQLRDRTCVVFPPPEEEQM